ncbi:CPBP family archaeomyxosortase MrtA [Thermococcus sp. JCM 11816]|uniref:CPBP family archaeomyxosortase MrtA n=1 Tax=Thermococcus sp. (strain JCM 11816 / KS-1) TaxID=1295125 RepID=UPI0034670DD9
MHTSFWDHVAIVSIFYLLIPAVISRLMGFQWGEVGISLPNRTGLKLFAVLFLASIPLSIYGRSIPPEMRSYYPVFPYSSAFDFVLGELAMGITMLAHEAFYRGFLLFPLAKKNEWLAVILQDIPPYTIVHIGKPGIEVPYAFIAGIVFAKMDLKGESFVPSFLLHWLGSAFFDVLCAL